MKTLILCSVTSLLNIMSFMR